MRKYSGSRAERERKDLTKIFQEMGLKIPVQTNLKIVDYSDITLDLDTETFKPYKKTYVVGVKYNFALNKL